ncbi:MAG: hypothetical protein K2P66_10555 [Lachnospiraceae bacterium]|nr:hypothetical protein [Lachnospiraceae bacterium]
MGNEREIPEKELEHKETDGQETMKYRETEGREDSIRREYDFAPDVKLKECRYCRVMIPKKAKVCPNCRMSLKRHWLRNLVAAVFAIAVIGVGGYYLSAHWGIMKDAAASVWMAQKQSALPVMSVTTVDNKELAAGGAAVEPSEVTNLSEAESESVSEGAGHPEDVGKQTEGAATETADTKKSTAVESKPDAKSAEDKQAKEAAGAETDGTDSQTEVESATEADMQTDLAKKERSQVTMAKQDSVLTGEEREDTEDEDIEGTGNTEDTRNTQKQNTANVEDTEETGNTEDTENIEDTQNVENAEATKDTKTPGTDVPAKKMDRQEQKFREECVLIGYKSILRNTERYLDTALMVEVQVMCQVDGGLFDDNTYYLCETEDDNNIIRYYIVRDDRETDDILILEGDMLTVYGQLFGTCKIPAELVEAMPTVPAISMLYYDLTGE